MEYEVEGARPRGNQRGLDKGCAKRLYRQARKLNRKNAMDCSRWKKQIIKD